MVETDSLSFVPKHAEGYLLREVSFRAQDGEALALLGADGSGKTTLLQVLAGLAPGLLKGKRQGQVQVGGGDPATVSMATRLNSVGLVLADPLAQLSGVTDSVEEEIAWGLGNLGIPCAEMHRRTEEIMSRLHLAALRRCHPLALSCGQQQLVALASVLVLGAKVLLLDEPGSNLDGRSRSLLVNLVLDLAAQGHTVVWATTQVAEAVAFPRWLCLENGALVYDGAPSLKTWGARTAPWTRLAEKASQKGLWQGPLPLTLEETVAAWRRK